MRKNAAEKIGALLFWSRLTWWADGGQTEWDQTVSNRQYGTIALQQPSPDGTISLELDYAVLFKTI